MARANGRKDGYRSVSDGLAAVAGEVLEEDLPTIRITIQFLASGELTYTIHRRGEEEGQGGYIPPADPAPARTSNKG